MNVSRHPDIVWFWLSTDQTVESPECSPAFSMGFSHGADHNFLEQPGAALIELTIEFGDEMFCPGNPDDYTLRDEQDRQGQIFRWSASDWNFLQEMHALDIDYFAGSVLFQIWMKTNGTREQQEHLASLNVRFRL